MIEIKNISKKLSKHQILKNISLTVEKGEVVTIIGPSGAGKTTFLRCLNMLNHPDTGEIDFNGETIQFPRVNKKDMLAIRKKTAMVFQQYALFINKTVIQNITEGLTTARHVNKKNAVSVAEDLLRKVGLYDKKIIILLTYLVANSNELV